MGRTGTYIALAVMVLVGVLGGILSWAGSGNAPVYVERTFDSLSFRITGTDPFTRCYQRQQWGTGVYYFPVEVETQSSDCYLPTQTMTGILIDEFEGAIFLEGRLPTARYLIGCDWVTWSFSPWRTVIKPPSMDLHDGTSRIWQVEVIGRRSPDWDFSEQPLAYGHLGMSSNAVVIEQFNSARLLSEYQGYSGQPAGNPVKWETNCDNPH